MFNPDGGAPVIDAMVKKQRANWEYDIDHITIEDCDYEFDVTGMRVAYHNAIEQGACYHVGASFLNDRLRKLSRAGFDAPMTKKAIQLIQNQRLKIFTKVV